MCSRLKLVVNNTEKQVKRKIKSRKKKKGAK